jgi:hypothetical protein
LGNHLSAVYRRRIPGSLVAHPSRLYAVPANDPWGINTPPWLILPLAPVGVVGSLGTCGLVCLTRTGTWKMLITVASLVAVMGCSNVVEIYLAPM